MEKSGKFEAASKYPWALHSKGARVILPSDLAPSQPPSYGLLEYLRPNPLPRAMQMVSGALQVLGPNPVTMETSAWFRIRWPLERTSGLFFPVGMSAEAMIAHDLFLRMLRAVMGESLQYCGEKPVFPLSLKCFLTFPPRNAQRREQSARAIISCQWSLDKFPRRTQLCESRVNTRPCLENGVMCSYASRGIWFFVGFPNVLLKC